MPESAYRIFSPTEGFLNEKIAALAIKGREHARRLGPFCNRNNELMCWVRWYTKSNGKKLKPHFKTYGAKKTTTVQLKKIIDYEIKTIQESKKQDIPRKTQKILIQVIENLIANNKSIPWAFKGKRLIDFSLTGNLLSGVRKAQKEHIIYPPFTKFYRLDVALVGNLVHSKPAILGAIEIENTHEVDLLKTLLVKSLGFPLFTIDIKGAKIEDITEEWCLRRLTETTFDSFDSRRRNYIYIHNMLYPVYVSNFENWGIGPKHQHVIFIDDEHIKNLCEKIELLKSSLNLSDESVNIMIQRKNENHKGSLTLFENEGAIAGPSWRRYNPNAFIRLVVERPVSKQGNIYIFHLIITKLLALHFNCLVGYKFDTGKSNWNKDETIWEVTRKHLNQEKIPKYTWENKRFCPKRVSEPINEILSKIPKAFNL